MRLPPWYLALPITTFGLFTFLPLGYLLQKAFSASPTEIITIVFHQRNLKLFVNTVGLGLAVVVCTTLIAWPMAWLTTSSDLRFKSVFTLVGVLPLAIPGYVTAYVLLSLTGFQGKQLIGFDLPNLNGFTGALIALTFYTFPYLFLNLRSAMLGLNPTLADSARSLSYSSWEIAWYVTLPQLRPAFLAGGLLIFLHVLGDFGVVSLMRYETFSYALFSQYVASFDRTYAAWLALILIAFTCILLFLETKALGGNHYGQTGKIQIQPITQMPLGHWRWIAYLFLLIVGFTSVIVPTLIVLFWSSRGFNFSVMVSVASVIFQSALVSVVTAILATVVALVIAYTSTRYPSTFSRIFERVSYIGYAMPPLAFALAWIFLSLQRFSFIYQTFWLLITAYVLHFLTESIGPIRSCILQISSHIEEAARSLGCSPLVAFLQTTFPLLQNGLLVSFTFVFLATMKELPITALLSPIGFDTLALRLWSHAEEAMFAEAAPYALMLLLVSLFFATTALFKKTETA